MCVSVLFQLYGVCVSLDVIYEINPTQTRLSILVTFLRLSKSGTANSQWHCICICILEWILLTGVCIYVCVYIVHRKLNSLEFYYAIKPLACTCFYFCCCHSIFSPVNFIRCVQHARHTISHITRLDINLCFHKKNDIGFVYCGIFPVNEIQKALSYGIQRT